MKENTPFQNHQSKKKDIQSTSGGTLKAGLGTSLDKHKLHQH